MSIKKVSGKKTKVFSTNTTIAVSKRQVGSGLPVTCPASQNEKAVCADITGKQHVSVVKTTGLSSAY